MKLKKSFTVMLASMIALSGSAFAADVVTNPFIGVTHIHRTLTDPRPLNINIVYVDLNAEGIRFKVTPSNGSAGGETTAEAVSTFLIREGAQIGINCGYFFWDSSIGGMNVMGYAASEGTKYSPFQNWGDWPQPYCALNITADNTASIIKPLPGYTLPNYYVSPFGTPIYNAAPGSEWIVRDGVKLVDPDWPNNVGLHPRTAGGITADDRLILVAIDGRSPGFSEGLYMTEVADLMLDLGAYNAIAFDGGGSTTMVLADPYPRVVNRPSDGQERLTANNLVVFADLNMELPPRWIFNTFENANEGTFTYSPGYSGSTAGIVADQSTADSFQGVSFAGDWSEKIFIKDDPAVSSVPDNSQGWFVRWVSGSSASPSQNVTRPVAGYLGIWAMTQTAGLKISICIDNEAAMERGIPKDMIADGQWHCYEWNLQDNAQWQGWVNGDGTVTKTTFTLDSIQLLGTNNDALLYLDKLVHDPQGSIQIPADCMDIWNQGLGISGDLNHDCYVGIDDVVLLAYDWLGDNPDYDIALGQSQGIIDLLDIAVIAQQWDQCNDPQNQDCQQ